MGKTKYNKTYHVLLLDPKEIKDVSRNGKEEIESHSPNAARKTQSGVKGKPEMRLTIEEDAVINNYFLSLNKSGYDSHDPAFCNIDLSEIRPGTRSSTLGIRPKMLGAITSDDRLIVYGHGDSERGTVGPYSLKDMVDLLKSHGLSCLHTMFLFSCEMGGNEKWLYKIAKRMGEAGISFQRLRAPRGFIRTQSPENQGFFQMAEKDEPSLKRIAESLGIVHTPAVRLREGDHLPAGNRLIFTDDTQQHLSAPGARKRTLSAAEFDSEFFSRLGRKADMRSAAIEAELASLRPPAGPERGSDLAITSTGAVANDSDELLEYLQQMEEEFGRR